ncbi:LuxR C-terminal-related transcriptional regulator [Streptomyces sp. NPDC051940]|uniref:ATP-binding protein n=1 Tax=Streptomyces sp. NPDC051940 TaxID=3155675 RepID=UPI003423FA60
MAFGATWRRSGQLPAEVTSFVGRAAELADLRELLTRARMVTLVGPGGVGKTRLGLRGAAQAAARFPDGTHLVELSGVKSSDLLPHAVSEALGLREQSGRPQVDAVVEYVADRRLLIVLDTCEHLVDACALLADLLLPQAPGLTILATSRQALDVPGEHVVPVAPLAVPGEDDGDCEALELFLQRARAAVPGFALQEGDRARAAALCRRLDGIPLAVELAAVRLRALSLDQLVTRLTDTFALLTGSRMTTLPRHQTLLTTIGWSHELCAPPERLLWARLSVFAGTFDLAAVESVCTDDELPAASVLDQLISLVDKSVVLRVGERGTRYRLLDTIREYGAERLRDAGGPDGLRRRHTAYYGSLVREFEARFATAEQLTYYRSLRPDVQELRAALGYAAGTGELPAMAGAMWPYWLCSGQPTEARHWLAQALEAAPEPSAGRAKLLAWYAEFLTQLGAHGESARLAREAGAMARAHGDEFTAVVARSFEGAALGFGGDAAAAGAVFEEVRDPLERLGARYELQLMLTHWGVIRLAADADGALAAAEELRALIGRTSEESYLYGYSCLIRGTALFLAGDLPGAGAELRHGVELHGAREDVLGTANTMDFLAWVAVGEGRHRRAAWLFGAADRLFALLGRERFAGIRSLQALRAEAVAAARDALGAPRYDTLYERGAALPSPRAVESAVADLDTPPAAAETGAPLPEPRTDALTRREREVAALVAEGLSNRAIAERLVISKRTADAHVEHILAKLGFSSRSEIAALVSGRGVSDGARNI